MNMNSNFMQISGSLSSETKLFIANGIANCTSLLDYNIIVILLRLSKCFNSEQVCTI